MIVAAGNNIHFWKNGHLDLKFLFPFIVLSIPCSFLGGLIPLEKTSFQLILATTLFAVGIKTVFFDKRRFDDHREGITLSWMPSAIIGGILGFAAGLTGVGGGVFLAPILYTSGVGNRKKNCGHRQRLYCHQLFFWHCQTSSKIAVSKLGVGPLPTLFECLCWWSAWQLAVQFLYSRKLLAQTDRSFGFVGVWKANVRFLTFVFYFVGAALLKPKGFLQYR